MPNHVTSEIVFRDVSLADQGAISEKVYNAEGRVDFNLLVPEPLNLWKGNEGSNHEKAFGKRLGMTWARENWGTKWNAYQCRPVERTNDTLTIIFDTAWSPPFPWLAALFNHFGRSFDHNWLDEGAEWSVEGKFACTPNDVMGLRWAEERASHETQARLHTLKWGVAEFPPEDEGDPADVG